MVVSKSKPIIDACVRFLRFKSRQKEKKLSENQNKRTV